MLLRDILKESEAADEAKKRGLVSKGAGNWYDKSGKFVAKTVDGKLQDVEAATPKRDTSMDKAVSFALQAHGDQKYGDKPYEYHLRKVFDNAIKFKGTPDAKAAAMLHDTIEDTNVTKDQLAHEFNPHIAHIVDLVSNQPSKEQTYQRIRTDPDAVFVKLCDRLANVSEGQKNKKYRMEQPLFRSILYRKGEFEPLWQAIERALAK
jgi:(p)ppGpp synthase/HD superfamily hydrolase